MRHGYSDDIDMRAVALWQGTIASATRGKRGQAFFKALVEALDAMPVKELIKDELERTDGAVCALGCLGKVRGVDLKSVDTEDWKKLGEVFDIAPQLAREVMFRNDGWEDESTPAQRWKTVRDWAAKQIRNG